LYKSLASRLSCKLINLEIIPEEKKNICSYGLEVFFSSITYSVIFLLIGYITSTFICSIVFFGGFYFIRHFSGGLHADTYFKCHLFFSINYLIVVMLLHIVPTDMYYAIILSVLCFCVVSIFVFAPVDHKNKRFIKTEYKRFKIRSRIYAVLLLILGVFVTFNVISCNKHILSFSFGTISATISMLGAKILNYLERRKSDYVQES